MSTRQEMLTLSARVQITVRIYKRHAHISKGAVRYASFSGDLLLVFRQLSCPRFCISAGPVALQRQVRLLLL